MAEQSITKSTIIVMACTLLGSFVGFVSQIVTAHYFGASKELDAFVAASIVPFIFYGFTNNSFTTALIYFLTKHKANDNKNMFNQFSNSFLNSAIIELFLLFIIFILLAPILAKILVPGFGQEEIELTMNMIRILSTTIFILGLTSVTSGLLYFKNKFLTPSLLRAFLGIGTIVSILLFQKNYSTTSLAIGLIIGSGIGLFSQYVELLKTGFSYKPVIPAWQHLKELLYVSVPLWATTLIYYSNKIINNIFASFLSVGSISVLNYAYIISSFPVLLISSSIATASFTSFTKNGLDTSKRKVFTELLNSTIRLTVFILLPISLILIILREEIIRLLLERGAFDAVATAKTAATLAHYSAGLIAFGIFPILYNALIALGEIKKNVIIFVSVLIFNTVLNAAFLDYGTTGLATAVSLSYWISCGVAIFFLRKLWSKTYKLIIIKFLAKILLAVIPVMLLLFVLKTVNSSVIGLLIKISVSLAVYAIFCTILNLKEMTDMKEKINYLFVR